MELGDGSIVALAEGAFARCTISAAVNEPTYGSW
jgi:hypothetical protein